MKVKFIEVLFASTKNPIGGYLLLRISLYCMALSSNVFVSQFSSLLSRGSAVLRVTHEPSDQHARAC
jgi:hypothetical protein